MRRSWCLTTRSPPDAKTDEGHPRQAARGGGRLDDDFDRAPRPATLMQADQIIVLGTGRIVEQGAPESALGRKGGLFAADGADAIRRGRGGSRMSRTEEKARGFLACAVEAVWRCVCQHRLRLRRWPSATICCSPSRIYTSRCCKAGLSIIHSDGDDGRGSAAVPSVYRRMSV